MLRRGERGHPRQDWSVHGEDVPHRQLLLIKDDAKLLTHQTLRPVQRRARPEQPPRPEPWGVHAHLGPGFPSTMTHQVSLHPVPIFVYGVVRIPLATKVHKLSTVHEDGAELLIHLWALDETHFHIQSHDIFVHIMHLAQYFSTFCMRR